MDSERSLVAGVFSPHLNQLFPCGFITWVFNEKATILLVTRTLADSVVFMQKIYTHANNRTVDSPRTESGTVLYPVCSVLVWLIMARSVDCFVGIPYATTRIRLSLLEFWMTYLVVID